MSFLREEPLYLCNQCVVWIMVKATTEGLFVESLLHQQIANGYLWMCTLVDAVLGQKKLTPKPKCFDFSVPKGMHYLFERHCLGDEAKNNPELYDTVVTYLRMHSFIGTETSNHNKRHLIIANKAFENVFLGNEKKKYVTQRELFGLSIEKGRVLSYSMLMMCTRSSNRAYISNWVL